MTLVETHEFTKDELDDWAVKCMDFAELLCARAFYPYQREMAHAICIDVIGNLGNTLTGLFARQSGKSETVANMAAALMVILPKLANMRDPTNPRRYGFPQLRKFVRGFWVGIFSPSSTQSSTTFKRLKDRLNSPEGREILHTPEFALDGYEQLDFVRNARDYIELNNGSFCLMMSADKQANIESKTFHLILLDESQDLDEFVVGKSIMPMGAATNATTVATGTPGTTKGFFYNMIGTNKNMEQERNAERRLQPQLHYEYDYKTVQKYNDNYRRYIIKEKRKLGEESDEFKMAYRLIWLLERGMALSQELFDELTIKSVNIVTSNRDDECVAGLDWGKSQDSTVLTVGLPRWKEIDEATGKVPVDVIYWWDKLGDDYESIFADLRDQVGRFNIRTLSCDATGVGEPLYDRLQANLLNTTVIPVRFTSQSKDHLYKNFLLMLQEKKVTWPGESRVRQRKYWKAFEHQMLNLQKEYKNGYLACHAPEDQRNAHDDFPDSLALMLWCLHEEAMPFVQVSNDNFYTGHNWHKNPHGFSLRG